MAVRTQEKHTRGHKEFSRLCREQGFGTVQCIQGHLDCSGLPGIHVSIRRTERLRMDDAMAQAAAEAGDRFPILAHRSILDGSQPYEIPDFSREEDCLQYENDTLSPFYYSDGTAPTAPCCSDVGYLPSAEQLQAYK